MESDGLNVPYSYTFKPGIQLDRQQAMDSGRELAPGLLCCADGVVVNELSLE